MIAGLGRCLVIAPQGLGDALEATPLIAALKDAGAAVDVAVLRPGPRELFEGLTDVVDRVMYLPYWQGGLGPFLASIVQHARKRRYNASFLAYPASRPEYQMLSWAFGALVRVAHAYWRPTLTNLLGLNTVLVPVASDTHNVLRNLHLLHAIGITSESSSDYLVPPSWRQRAQEPGLLAFHIGTVTHHGLEAKRWPRESFSQLASRMIKRRYAVHFIAGPDEREATRKLVAEVEGSSLFEGRLPEVARFLSSATAAVTNDSGIGHLAAAVGTPVLALHGPTPVEGGPFGPEAVRFRPSPCPACFDPRLRNTRCALDIDFACLKRDMPVEIVEHRLMALLQAIERDHSHFSSPEGR